jgi:hypothetical protein
LNPADRPFSVFAWVKGGEPGQVIISQADRKVGRITERGHTWLGTDPSDGRLLTSLMDMPFCSLQSDTVVTDGRWHHIGLVYDHDGRHRQLYVDGVEVAADTGIATEVPPDTGLYFGAGKSLAPADFFSGLIDDIRIYNQTLNAEEINEMAR